MNVRAGGWKGFMSMAYAQINPDANWKAEGGVQLTSMGGGSTFNSDDVNFYSPSFQSQRILNCANFTNPEIVSPPSFPQAIP